MDPARSAAVRSRHDGADRYELAEPIATGGMAVIRRGFDRWTQREIAHKRLRIEGETMRPRLSALFQREYDTLAKLEHPNIVEVYDYGFDAQGPYYTMELLSGRDLSKLAPLPYREACRILRDISSALALVHARRLLHRDVSPNNVRLTSNGIAKLIDFGALTSFGRPGEIAGTPAFIAPECLEEVELDQRTDLYSLGALAYWTLTGNRAVEVQRIDDLARAWRTPIIAPSAHVPELPTALDDLICSLMSHDREHRPRTAAEVIESLTTIAGLDNDRSERKVAYSYLKHPPLAGRSAAVGALRAALASAIEGRGGVVIVEGVAGLGRSALFEHFTIDAQLHGATVLRAEGRAAVGPHGVARRLTQLGARIYPDLEGSERSRRQLLGLEKGKGDAVVHPMEALERTAQAAARLRRLLLSLSARGPLAIVVDDADLADPDSIGLLASMAEELVRHPILLLLSVHGPVDQDMVLAYERLSEDAHTIALQTLEETEVIELVQGIFGAVPNTHRTALWLHHETGGNPAQCVDLLRLLLQRGAIRYERGTFTLPHDIDGDVARDRRSNALLTRLSGVTSNAMRLVELLSLHRGSLSAAQLALASGIPQREVVLAVEQLVQRGVAFFVADCISLRGESLRAVVEKAIEVERKRALHLALALAIGSPGEDELGGQLERAWHLFRSGESGELSAADLIVHLLSTHGHDVSMSAGSVPLLEAALAVYERRGASEPQCAPLLAALSVTGYFGNLEAHRKYLRRALAALSQQSGLALAQKLAPWLGPIFALWIGLIWATLFGPFFPRSFGRGSIKRRVQDLLTAASCGAATAAIVYDVEAAREIKQLLAPFAGFPRRTAPGYGHQFCNATADQTMAGSLHAREAYARIRSGIQDKVLLLDERLRKQLILGCLHGQAHSEVEYGDGASLLLADELEQGSAFFAPSAEAARSIYYMMRGQHQTAELHRARCELLALRGGTSWATAAVLALRTIGPSALTRDSVTLEHAAAELDRLAKVEPALNKFCAVARARLALLRGQPGEAHDLLTRMLAESHEPLEAHRFLRGTYAEALCELGQFAEAKAQCLLALEGLSEAQRNYSSILRLPFVQLARAETGLGNFVGARELLEKHVRNAAIRKNPLEQGTLQRELALLALAERDADEFELHCDAMIDHYQQTQCTGLLKQRDELWSLAIACGVRERPSISISLAGTSAASVDCETFVEARIPAKPESE